MCAYSTGWLYDVMHDYDCRIISVAVCDVNKVYVAMCDLSMLWAVYVKG